MEFDVPFVIKTSIKETNQFYILYVCNPRKGLRTEKLICLLDPSPVSVV